MKAQVVAALAAAALLAGCATTDVRPRRDQQDLIAYRRGEDVTRANAHYELVTQFMKRMAAKVAAAGKDPGRGPATIDILVVSGGGDWGAFGAGVLKGWARVKGDLARPEFDAVTGVSTGALIAPFAFLGDEQSIEKIVRLYRNPAPDTAISRGWLFFLPGNPSFFVTPGLERTLVSDIDRAMVERLAAQKASGRGLLVNTTNVDLGEMRVWDLIAEARVALTMNDVGHFHRILLASAGIPGAFPPQIIGDYLYVDGAVTGNILYAGETNPERTLFARWRKEHPNLRLPRLRFWVIFNNQLRFPPEMTQNRWPSVLGRTTIMTTQTSTVNSIRHLYALAEIERLRNGTDVEVRMISVPEDYLPSKPGTFVKEVMEELADLGEKMGAEPKSWQSTPP